MSNPISKEQEEKKSKKIQKIWKKQKFFMVIPSLEGTMATSESIKGLRPADSDFEK